MFSWIVGHAGPLAAVLALLAAVVLLAWMFVCAKHSGSRPGSVWCTHETCNGACRGASLKR